MLCFDHHMKRVAPNIIIVDFHWISTQYYDICSLICRYAFELVSRTIVIVIENNLEHCAECCGKRDPPPKAIYGIGSWKPLI